MVNKVKNGTKEDDTKLINCYFKNNQTQRKYWKQMMEIWTESGKFNTSQRLADQARLILKKHCLSDLEILKVYGQINHEEHNQREPSKHKILKTKLPLKSETHHQPSWLGL